jgi:hypothetical protein
VASRLGHLVCGHMVGACLQQHPDNLQVALPGGEDERSLAQLQQQHAAVIQGAGLGSGPGSGLGSALRSRSVTLSSSRQQQISNKM